MRIGEGADEQSFAQAGHAFEDDLPASRVTSKSWISRSCPTMTLPSSWRIPCAVMWNWSRVKSEFMRGPFSTRMFTNFFEWSSPRHPFSSSRNFNRPEEEQGEEETCKGFAGSGGNGWQRPGRGVEGVPIGDRTAGGDTPLIELGICLSVSASPRGNGLPLGRVVDHERGGD